MKRNYYLVPILFLSVSFQFLSCNDQDLIQEAADIEKFILNEIDIKPNDKSDVDDLLLLNGNSLVLTSFQGVKLQSFNKNLDQEWYSEVDLNLVINAPEMIKYLDDIIMIGMFGNKNQLFIRKVNSQGEHKFTFKMEDNFETVGYAIVANDSGELVFAGNRLISAAGIEKEIIFGKLDINGNLLWLKTFADDNTEKPFKIVVNQNKDYSLLFAGGALFDKIGFLTFNDEGEILNQKELPIFYEQSRGYDFISTSDGSLLLLTNTGTSSRPILVSLIKLNSDFELDSETKVGGTDSNHYSSKLIETKDNGFVFCGSIFTKESKSLIYLSKIDPNGIVLWERQFEYGDYITGKDVQETEDGDLIVLGGTLEKTFVLFKTDSEGRPL